MQNDSTKKRLSPTVTYLLTGLIFACPTLFAAGWMVPEWASLNMTSPNSLAIIHSLVLGFMLTVAFGVLYQVIPIAFQAPPMPRHVFYWHLPVHAASVLVMIYGFANFKLNLVAAGGTTLCLAAAAYLFILQGHYRQARNKTLVHRGLSFPIAALIIVLLIGIWQAFAPGTVSVQLVMTHAVVGGLAFWGGLVMIISYKFVPMFSLSHGYQASLSRSKWLYFCGITILIAGEWLTGATPFAYTMGRAGILLGSLVGILGTLSFVFDLFRIFRAKKKKRLVNPMREALLALGFIVCGQMLLFLSVPLANFRMTVFAAYLFAFGGLVPLTLAYMQKIVPFLWFEYRFSKRPERKTAPLLDDMVPKQISKWAIILYYAGMVMGAILLILGLVTSEYSSTDTLIRILPGTIMAISIILLFVSLRHVLTIGGTRPED